MYIYFGCILENDEAVPNHPMDGGIAFEKTKDLKNLIELLLSNRKKKEGKHILCIQYDGLVSPKLT